MCPFNTASKPFAVINGQRIVNEIMTVATEQSIAADAAVLMYLHNLTKEEANKFIEADSQVESVYHEDVRSLTENQKMIFLSASEEHKDRLSVLEKILRGEDEESNIRIFCLATKEVSEEVGISMNLEVLIEEFSKTLEIYKTL